jgi:hypothetical protein
VNPLQARSPSPESLKPHFFFAFRAREPIRFERDRFGQEFQRQLTICRVAGALHLTHPSSVKEREDFVSTESHTGCERHGFLEVGEIIRRN